MHTENVIVTFLPTGATSEVPLGTNLMKAANKAGLQVNAFCGGKGNCGKCQAKVSKGLLSEATKIENKFISQEQQNEGTILLCQKQIYSDVTIEMELSPGLPGRYILVKGNLMALSTEIDPLIYKTYHQLSKPSVKDQTPDLERILNQLPAQVEPDIKILDKIPNLLRDNDYCVTSVVFDQQLIGLEAGDTSQEAYGIAVDIGTTTIAGYLVNLMEGKIIGATPATNRQIMFGADVLSRVIYSLENADGLSELRKSVIQSIDEVISRLIEETGIASDKVYFITLIGNTVMSHLLLGVSPRGVATSPFVPAFSRGLTADVGALGITAIPSHTRFVLLPNIAGYVGSDTIGVMLSTKILDLKGTVLAIDIGTNGEIILASGGRILTCSAAAGPAFEGACISQGMRAEPGAISRVHIDSDVRLEVIGDIEPVGICGSALIDAVSELLRLRILKRNGKINNPSDCPPDVSDLVRNRIKQGDRGLKFVLSEGKKEVAITQKDIHELQMAKGAIRAGIEILLDELKTPNTQLDTILLAGAFGSNLQSESVKRIGLFPEIELDCIKPVGNAAGAGAVMALLSKRQLQLASQLANRVEHIELSLHQSFVHSYAKGMYFEV